MTHYYKMVIFHWMALQFECGFSDQGLNDLSVLYPFKKVSRQAGGVQILHSILYMQLL